MAQTIAGCDVYIPFWASGQDELLNKWPNIVTTGCVFSVQKWVISVPSHAAASCLSKARVGLVGCA